MKIAGETGNQMSNTNTILNKSPDSAVLDRVPPEAKPLFYRVPILCTESGAAYMQIVDSVASTIHPDDIMEWMFVRNIVDHIYNILFLRQVVTGIVDIKRKDGLESLLSSLLFGIKDVSKHADEFFWILKKQLS
jgi:hypothetical protein